MSAPSDIFLKWENHNGALASFLYSQLGKENFLDVTIAAEGKCINVHRLVLCASSPYFENILGRFEKPAVVILQNIKFCDVQSIIEYIYKGEISLSNNQLGSFLEAAKMLKIKGLTEEGNNPCQVQEPIMAVEMPTDSELTAPNRPTRKAAESSDDPFQAMLLETGENVNHPEEEQDVVIVDAPPRPAPIMINLDETLLQDEQEDEMVINNEDQQGSDSYSNASVEDESSSSSDNSSDDDEEVDPQQRPETNGSRLANRLLSSCGACGMNFNKKFALNRHTVKGNCQTVPYFRCELCGVCSRRRWIVRGHFSRIHRNLSSSQYDAHIIEMKATLPKFACNLCSHRSESRSSLRMHQKRKHVGKSQTRHSFMGV